MQQISMWEGNKGSKKAQSFAGRLRESGAVYQINGDENTSMELILSALIGDIPDETMKSLLLLNLVDFLNLSKEELMTYPGIGPSMAARLMAAFALTKKLASAGASENTVIRCPEDIFYLMKNEAKLLDKEYFSALLLNTKNHVIGKETISIGTLNSSMVHPRELFKQAIRRSAAAVILVHNHPSGDPTPSREDISLTKRLIEAGEIIGIDVLDHIVLGFDKFTSLKSKGLI
ncbi:DNA replication and repair protein RadC [Desulforamulus reducens MI-1]|uniref:DNA replication and repair protein RadC n=1 Tax=Desulforamulus reducens (strain ATCC BAA-1160 / DSM 100696 / MI-1) TaxID=349161 RepID=A4J365_DESRM|nr:DNA repair protein RadC [Desulforamulus reducens]ABO49518.1 DNA replication and repair protein RadC [Desulforamulus reducens MI-1]